MICDNAFLNCSKLFSISLDATESITFGDNSFKNCSALKTVGFQETKNVIDNSRKYSNKYKSVPNIFNHLSIGQNCFEKCILLSPFKCNTAQEIIIYANSFRRCNKLTDFSLKGSEYIELPNNFLNEANQLKSFELQGNCLSYNDTIINNCSALTIIIISVQEQINITKDTFKLCKSLSSVKFISKSKIEIKEESFCHLDKLETIYLEGQEVIIEDKCFINANNESNNKVQSSSRNIEIKSTTNAIIGSCCFSNMNNIETVEINGTNVLIKEQCFNKTTPINKISIISTEKITFHSCLFKCTNISKLFLSSPYVLLKEKCFSSSSKINSIEIYGAKIIINDNVCSKNAEISTIRISKSDEINLNDNAFLECSSLSSISLDASKSITLGNCCFKNCSLLKSIYIQKYKMLPSNQKLNELEVKIGRCCFMKCDKINYVVFQGINKAIFNNDAFNGVKNLGKIEINTNNELSLGNNCFCNCNSLKQIKFSSKSSLILGRECFKGLIKPEKIELNSSIVEVGENCFIDSFSEEIYAQSLAINASDLKLGNNSFKNCKYLSSIRFIDIKNIKIGENAFENCQKMETISINAKSSINISDYCFKDSKNLKNIYFDCEELNLGNYCFNNCKSLSNISFFNHIKNIRIFSNILSGCESFHRFKAEMSSQIIIENHCFSGTTNLETIELISNDLMIGSYIFENCKKISKAILKYKNQCNIHSDAFKGCNSKFKYEKIQITNKP